MPNHTDGGAIPPGVIRQRRNFEPTESSLSFSAFLTNQIRDSYNLIFSVLMYMLV
jgi:hypothetical protein